MPTLTRPQNLNADDYEAIEAAVMETVRGRWFLMEFARRSRATELSQIRDAITRLERSLSTGPAPPTPLALKYSPRPEVTSATRSLVQREHPRSSTDLKSLSRFDELEVEEKLALFG